jgi:uncharacterized membrane protein
VLFGLLFFIPVFGMAIGAGMGALMGKVGKAGINKEFEDQVRTAGPQRARLQWRRPDRRTRMTRDRL